MLRVDAGVMPLPLLMPLLLLLLGSVDVGTASTELMRRHMGALLSHAGTFERLPSDVIGSIASRLNSDECNALAMCAATPSRQLAMDIERMFQFQPDVCFGVVLLRLQKLYHQCARTKTDIEQIMQHYPPQAFVVLFDKVLTLDYPFDSEEAFPFSIDFSERAHEIEEVIQGLQCWFKGQINPRKLHQSAITPELARQIASADNRIDAAHKAGLALSDPEVVIDLLKYGIRFSLQEFGSVRLSSANAIFPLLTDSLWTKSSVVGNQMNFEFLQRLDSVPVEFRSHRWVRSYYQNYWADSCTTLLKGVDVLHSNHVDLELRLSILGARESLRGDTMLHCIFREYQPKHSTFLVLPALDALSVRNELHQVPVQVLSWCAIHDVVNAAQKEHKGIDAWTLLERSDPLRIVHRNITKFLSNARTHLAKAINSIDADTDAEADDVDDSWNPKCPLIRGFLLTNRRSISARYRECNGGTMLHCAMRCQLPYQISRLLWQRVDVKVVDWRGHTAMHYATTYLLEFLFQQLAASTDVFFRRSFWWSQADFPARQERHMSVEQRLVPVDVLAALLASDPARFVVVLREALQESAAAVDTGKVGAALNQLQAYVVSTDVWLPHQPQPHQNQHQL